MVKIVSIFGSIAVYALAFAVVLVLIELIWYRICHAKKDANADKKHVSIITGASSGLGSRFALKLDKILPENEEIWLVARRKERLEALSGQLNHRAKCISCDLTELSAIEKIGDLLKEENAAVNYLVNCAGFGKIGKISEMPLSDQEGMINLNCSAGISLTKACLPYLGKGSHIVNVCSTAGFQPFQSLNIYAATKAFFLRYSRALRMELLPAGIIVTAVCPYWIKDTEFIGIAGPDKKADIRAFPLASEVNSVAALSLLGSRIGLPVVTPGIVCTLHRWFSKLLPDTVLGYIWELLRRA